MARVVMLLLMAAPRLARAEPRLDPPAFPVRVTLVGQLGRDPTLARRVSSWFDPARFRVTVRGAPTLDPARVLSPERDGAVHVWILLGSPPSEKGGAVQARLYFAMRSGPDGEAVYLLRDLALDSGADEMGVERVAQVLYLSTMALLEGQEENSQEELARTLDREPATQARSVRDEPGPTPGDEVSGEESRARARGRRTGAAMGYGASLRSEEGVAHGPRTRLAIQLGRRLGVQAIAQSGLPRRREIGPLELRLYGVTLDVVASLRQPILHGVALEWVGGAGLDIVRYAAVRSLDVDVIARGREVEARPELLAGASALFGRHSPQLAVGAECRAALVRTHYDVVAADSRRVIARPAPFIPTLAVEVRF